MSEKTEQREVRYFDTLLPNSPPATIVWHARGNQGAVGASALLVELIARLIEAGEEYDATSAPIFGAAKEGEPIRVYNRIGRDKIEAFYTPTSLDVAVIVDTSIARGTLLAGTHANTIYLVNTPDDPETIARKLKLGPRRIIAIDATKIAKEVLATKRAYPNTVILGALLRIFPFLTMEHMGGAIEHAFEEKGEKIAHANVAAMKRGFAEAVEFDGRDTDIPFEPLTAPKPKPWNELPIGCAVPSNMSFSANKTGSWGTDKPVFDSEKCINCRSCIEACPDASIIYEAHEDGTVTVKGIDYDYCKGCGRCAAVCPTKAIIMRPKTEATK